MMARRSVVRFMCVSLGDEARVALGGLDHGMAAVYNLDAAAVVHLGAGVAPAHGGLGEGAERVELRRRVGAALYAAHALGHARAQAAEVVVFELADAGLGGIYLRLELLELGGDVALAVLERLLAHVVGRELRHVGAVGYLDGVAGEAVIGHAQLLYAAALLLAALELRNEGGRVLMHGAQALDLLGEAAPEHAAVAYGDGRVVADGEGYVVPHVLERVHVPRGGEQGALGAREQLAQPRQARAGLAEGQHIPPVRRLIGDAGDEPGHIAHALEGAHELAAQDVVRIELAHRGEAGAYVPHGDERHLDPGAQQPRAHGRLGIVEHCEEAPALLAGADVGRELEAAARRPVELHVEPLVEQLEAVYVPALAHLRLVQVAQQRPGGREGEGAGVEPELGEAPGLELREHAPGGVPAVEIIPAALLHGRAEAHGEEHGELGAVGGLLAEYDLAGAEAAQLAYDVGDAALIELDGAELARGRVAEGAGRPVAQHADGGEIVRPAALEHRLVRDRAGRYDADDAALHEALGRGGVLLLLADRDLEAALYEPRDVAVRAVIGHAAHGHLLLGRLRAVAGREREVELAGGDARVLVEELVEVPEAEKEQALGVFVLYLIVLLLQRRHLFRAAPSVRRASAFIPSHGPLLSPRPGRRRAPRCCRRLCRRL